MGGAPFGRPTALERNPGIETVIYPKRTGLLGSEETHSVIIDMPDKDLEETTVYALCDTVEAAHSNRLSLESVRRLNGWFTTAAEHLVAAQR